MGLPRSSSRGRVQGVPPHPEMTCCFLIQLIYSAKNYTVLFDMYSQQFTLYYCLVKSFLFVFTFIIPVIIICFCHQSVTLFLTVAPPSKKNPGSAPVTIGNIFKQWRFFYQYVAKSVSMTYLTFWLVTHKKP